MQCTLQLEEASGEIRSPINGLWVSENPDINHNVFLYSGEERNTDKSMLSKKQLFALGRNKIRMSCSPALPGPVYAFSTCGITSRPFRYLYNKFSSCCFEYQIW